MKSFFLVLLIIIQNSCSNEQKKIADADQLKMLDTSQLDKVSEMLNEEIFWNIVNKSVQGSENSNEQEIILKEEISKLTLKEIIGFRMTTDKLLFDTYNSNLWCAGYLMNQGCSDDGFEYFRNWVISRGRDVFYKAKSDPDSLISEIDYEVYGFYEFESFWFVAIEVFEQKTGKELRDYIDYETFKTTESNYPRFEFTWEEDKPETMKAICPKLYEKFWK